MVHPAPGQPGTNAWGDGVDASLAGKLDSTVANSTYGRIVNGVLNSRLLANGTDESTTFLAELATLQSTGGKWVLPSGTIRVDSQVVVSNDGASTYPRQKAMVWVGTGAYTDPVGGSGPYPDLTAIGGTILDLRYTGGGSSLPKIDTRGKGVFESTGITYTDQGTSSNPFIKTTNTTLNFHQNAFVGNPSKAGVTCNQDVFILGGLDVSVAGASGPDAAFQGYGTVIKDNYFARIRRATLLQAWCNGTVIRDNNIWISCGSNLAGGAAIELNPGSTSGVICGNGVIANTIEAANYPYPIKMDYATGNTISGNSFYDPSATTLAYTRTDSSHAIMNYIQHSYFDASVPGVSEQTPTLNTIVNPFSEGGTGCFPWVINFSRGLTTDALNTTGVGVPEIVLGASSGLPVGVYLLNTGSPNGVVTANIGSLCIVKNTTTNIATGAALWTKVSNPLENIGWAPVDGRCPIATKTASYTLTADDSVILADGVGLTMTLPHDAAEMQGRKYTIKNLNASPLTVGTSGTSIDGSGTATLAQWATGTYISNGVSPWYSI